MWTELAREGPPLEGVVRRLAETPPDFLTEPRLGARGVVHVAAVVRDVLVARGADAGAPELRADALAPFEATDADARNRLSVALLLCWLAADPWFAGAPPAPAALLRLLRDGAYELAPTPAGRYVNDPERREEMARVALAALGLRPAGESPAQAADRLTSLSSSERTRVAAAAAAAERRAREVREALRRKAAEESADKWTRE